MRILSTDGGKVFPLPSAFFFDFPNLVGDFCTLRLHGHLELPNFLVELAHCDLEFPPEEVPQGIHGHLGLLHSSSFLRAVV